MKNLDKVISEFEYTCDGLSFTVCHKQVHINLDMRGSDGVDDDNPHLLKSFEIYRESQLIGKVFRLPLVYLAVEAYCLEKYNTGEYPRMVYSHRDKIYGKYGSDVVVLLC